MGNLFAVSDLTDVQLLVEYPFVSNAKGENVRWSSFLIPYSIGIISKCITFKSSPKCPGGGRNIITLIDP